MSASDSVTDFDTFAQPVLVAGAISLKKKILIWLFRALILCLLYLWHQNNFVLNDGSFFVFLFAGTPYICYEIFLLILFLNRRWFLITDDGFVYSSLYGSKTVRLNDIIGYSISVKELPREIHFFGEIQTKIKRQFRLWIQNRKRPICLNYTGRSVLPYGQIEAAGLISGKNGLFGIAPKDEEQQGLEFGTGNRNFYPGLVLFDRIMQEELMRKNNIVTNDILTDSPDENQSLLP